MALKSNKDVKSTIKKNVGNKVTKKPSVDPSTEEGVNDQDADDASIDSVSDIEIGSSSAGSDNLGLDEDDFDDDIEIEASWKKKDDEDWDPDFDEFDLPKSKHAPSSFQKRTAAKKKNKSGDDDTSADSDFSGFGLFGNKSGRGSDYNDF